MVGRRNNGIHMDSIYELFHQLRDVLNPKIIIGLMEEEGYLKKEPF